MKHSPLTLVVGASENPDRYSCKAAHALVSHGYRIALLGSRKGTLLEHEIFTGTPAFEQPDTITLYIGPAAQQGMMDYLLSLKPRRIIFNPGTENTEFESRARNQGIEVLEACTLVLLSTKTYFL